MFPGSQVCNFMKIKQQPNFFLLIIPLKRIVCVGSDSLIHQIAMVV